MGNKVAEIVTEKILNKLNQGEIPWHKKWSVITDSPRNVISNKEYKGINTWLLLAEGFNNPFWLTFKQVNDLGGKVKKGSTGACIIYWTIRPYTKTNKKGEEVLRGIPMLKYYYVYNIEQTEGCKFPEYVTNYLNGVKAPEFNPIEQADKIVDGYINKPDIQHLTQNRAYYSKTRDLVVMPPKNSFETESFYYATLFHELGHSTGHTDRLNRSTLAESGSFGDHEYSKEELVAEMTASILMANCNLFDDKIFNNSTAYIQSWLKALKNDTNLFLTACQLAQKASDYILGDKVLESDELTEAELALI